MWAHAVRRIAQMWSVAEKASAMSNRVECDSVVFPGQSASLTNQPPPATFTILIRAGSAQVHA